MVDTAIILYKECVLRLWRWSWLTLLCRISGWWVQATRAINSMVCLQNLLGTTLVFRAVFKTKQQPPRSLFSIQPKSQTSTLTLSLHHLKPHSQSCAPSTNSQQLWGGGTSGGQGCRHISRRRLSVQGSWSGSSSWSLELTRHLAAAFRPWGGEGGAPVQSKTTQEGCTSWQWSCRRVVLQIHEVQGTSGSKDHIPALEAHSTVQHSWLQPCPWQDHLSWGSKLRNRERNS